MERRIKKGVIKRSVGKLREFFLLENEEDIFYDLPRAAFAALNLGRDHQAADLARQRIRAARPASLAHIPVDLRDAPRHREHRCPTG